MSSPTPHLRHQASLENIISFTSPPPLTAAERAVARDTFGRIVQHFENVDDARPAVGRSYSQPRLIRYTHEFALSEESRDVFLRAFFLALDLPIGVDNVPLCFEDLEPLFRGFAEYLIDNFFLPLKASTRRTPQPSPTFHSAILRAQGVEGGAFIGTPERLSSLRGRCLIRDRHRCVISRAFDLDEFIVRYRQDANDARDDDGALLSQPGQEYHSLEVAHIIPHTLTSSSNPGGSDLDKAREAALAILNMFDTGVAYLIDGVDIDQPRNALTLSTHFHQHFGAFQVFFDAIPGQDHTYRIETFYPPPVAAQFKLPVTRELFLTENRTIDPPSPRLLAVHRAIAHILHLSAAGEYINNVLRDMEDNVVRADGSTDLGRMMAVGLRGWHDHRVF